MTGSHIFVSRGSLTSIACDAWMLPTDQNLSVRTDWRRAVNLSSTIDKLRGSALTSGSVLALAAPGWPYDRPLPVFTAVPLYGATSGNDLLPALREFIRTGAAAARKRRDAAPRPDLGTGKPRNRPNPLLAMPLFGTGAGGGGSIRGEVMGSLLAECRALAAAEEVDVVLVLKSERDFALAQHLRRATGEQSWDALDPSLQLRARSLAEIARTGRLVPFMGAGVSVSAGAPTWDELIDRLAARTDLTEHELPLLKQKNVLDQADILRTIFAEKKGDGRPSLPDAIVKEVKLERYGLAPALLASLPSKQAITLNYDELFEKAVADTGAPLRIIPGRESAETDRWLLKLHGSVADPSSIVLTREDYLGYNATRSALSALVKATLITHHLLFVGFGLSDDHFHEIVHDVRRALPPSSDNDQILATALTLSENALDKHAWKGKLELLPMRTGPVDIDAAARTLEIFLDMLLAYATDSHSYLLADGYSEALTAPENSLREKLLTLYSELDQEEAASSGGERVLKMLHELGIGAET